MCGISLLISTEKPTQDQSSALQRMQQAQQHRGPDSGGEVVLPWAAQSLFMGSRRLQILDPGQQADQPMHRQWQQKQGWLSYNGEIYNFTDLRNELLQLNCSFSSGSDTEVVLYALLVWGKEALHRFNGMFALAYYETAEGQEPTLLLARDRWGQKPLYYASAAGNWLAASELQALFSTGLLKKALNQQQVYHYLRYKYAARPQTFFTGVQELEPGHYLQLKPGQEIIRKSFIPEQLPLHTESLQDGPVLERLEELLVDALVSQLQADRPPGLFLSGGIDSTLMLALLRKHAAWQLPLCFTIGHAKTDAKWGTQDTNWSEKAARQYEAYHHTIVLEADSVLDRFQELALQQDQPIADSAWLTTCLLSEFASKKVKAVMTGAGADELFGGYNRHKAFAWYLQHQKWLTKLLPLLKSSGVLLPTGLSVPGRGQMRLLRKFSSSLSSDPYQTFLNFLSLAILPTEHHQHPASFPHDKMQWALEHDRQHYLISDVLALNDKAGMQYNIEARMPYLDNTLSNYVQQLPPAFLQKKGQKWLLKSLLEQNGGKVYTQRRKEGFGLPFGLWVQQGKTEALWQWLQHKEHPMHRVLPPTITSDLLKAHKKGQADYSQELIALALLAPWLEKHFG